ncbi:Shedu anti-phage system protein SduA domain-containing protein [Rossellomorea aquimaris]|uniref:Shedu anti-phage system protein SduA domain-containing protein n=1 Tax=Rossellomorea aquimaris TaxID=189382 RepID=UPI0037CAC672
MNNFIDVFREGKFKKAKEEFDFLLESKFISDEKIFQDFFERNPYYLPGATISNRLTEPDESYAPFPGAVIAQPPLRTDQIYIPDFLWLAYDKDTFYPVFIEIEAPSKKWFNKDGTLTAKFNQAYHQLMTWKNWFDKGDNKKVFFTTLRIPYFLSEKSILEPKFFLIYGRDKEFTSNNKHLIRKSMEHSSFKLLTYDDLRISYKNMYLTSAKLILGEYKFNNSWRGSPVRFLLTNVQLIGGDKEFVELMKPLIKNYRGENIRMIPEEEWGKMHYRENYRDTIVISERNEK